MSLTVFDDASAVMSAPRRAPYSIMLMAFGQSNADVHDAGPRLYPSAGGHPADDLPVVMPNDGKGIRGYMGGASRTKITGFVPVCQASPKVQSLLAAAGARLLHDLDDPDLRRVIVRSEARGGRRFFGIRYGDIVVDGIFRDIDGRESVIFANLIRTIRECIDVSSEEGCPIRLINMVWLHGESDRSMPRAEYGGHFLELIQVLEGRFADDDVAFEWTVVQPAGTGPKGSGNLWPNRMSIFDVADARDNVSVAIAGYPYQQMDGSHYSGYGKLHLGENLGRMIARRVAGKPHSVPRLAETMLQGQDAVLKISATAPLFLDGNVTTAPRGTVMGFHARDRSGAIAFEISVTGEDTLKLHFDRAPDPQSLVINYAYTQHRRGDLIIEGNYPVGGGCLRTTASVPSILLEGETLHDWVAGFTVGPFFGEPAPQESGFSGAALRQEEEA